MKTLILMAVILLSSCVSMKYTVTPATMTVKDGKPTFQQTGKSVLLQDTIIHNIYIIHKKN
jgi:hypothetical protein